jgi:hypothetical protein
VKRIYWLLVIAASLAVGRPATFDVSGRPNPGAFRDLVVTPAVSDNLALLFSQFDTELVLCLEGEWRGPDLYITDFRMPHILVSETGRVQASGCKSNRRSVGTWHNHPAPGPTFAKAKAEVLARNCYLSRTDIADFRRRAEALVTVVSCAPHTFAFWSRADVEEAESEVALLPPPEGQLMHYTMQDELRAGPLTQARRR